MVPTVGFPPTTPFTCQVTAVFPLFATVAVNCCVNPACTLGVFGLSETLIGKTTVTVAVSDFVVSATEIAFTVVAPAGTVAGAVYRPLALIVPTVALPPGTVFTCHVTVVFVAFVTVAVNCCIRPVTTVAVFGETVTVTAGGADTVTATEADLVVSATEIAVTVTEAGLGTALGAV